MESPNLHYNYEPLLGPEHIRTLTLQGTSNGIISCTIQQISVTEGGYQALSYVWGSEEKLFHAQVLDADGRPVGTIPLTKNLNDALQDLWNAAELTSKLFWIDQICIDQEDGEKSHQVALMGKIYENAKRVVTYLGPVEDEEVEEERLELLKRLYNHFLPNLEILSQMWDLYTAYHNRSSLPVSKLPNDLAGDAISEERWQSLVDLCFGEWATRLWIVQEQTLNTDTVMLHGSRLLSWETVAIISMLFYLDFIPRKHVDRFWRKGRRPFEENPWDISESIFAIWRTYRLKRKTPGGVITSSRDILSNMFRFQNLQCRDHRDRIYALLAISSDALELGISPDYSKSPQKIFLDASISIINHRKDLVMLNFACHMDNLSDFTHPSWAIALPQPVHLQPNLLEPVTFRPHPQPNVHPPALLHSRGKSSVLIVRGRIVDRISLATAPLYSSRSFDLGIGDAAYMETCSQYIGALSDVLYNLGITLENAAALCRAMILNPTWQPLQGQGSLTDQTAYHFWCYLRYLARSIEEDTLRLGLENHTAVRSDQLIKILAPSILRLEIDSFSITNKLSAIEDNAVDHVWKYAYMEGRSFCITKEKRVCSCSSKIESGDVIAAFCGADRLFVLRPTGGGRYRLVGDAYVDGLMFGEAYEGVNADEVDYDIGLI
ncbi:HET-domain-containing protein [Hyaloscypha variabilis F]|uniref:HET-domain-containing protein n=1 Tax=Hyaloscypha variabilis (strain UAMH 11265 / GT02V1 / F) TaxID=1149755 RepID=A0A2J6QVK5_HYAVF|nr:HET-domain-containing protein [Hyaloscypha variabilis F]